jgi:hypothetical protein
MPEDLGTLCLAAVSIGFLHTLFGPDHYLPFVAMSRVGGWSLSRTATITLLCGVGHVLSSVLLGLVGIAFGILVLKLEHIEAIRGDLAGWLLLTFGLLYFSWGLACAIRNHPHSHLHAHGDGVVHAHAYADDQHLRQPGGEHQASGNPNQSPETAGTRQMEPRRAMTPWVLFTIFLFGPCEPLIPMLMYPAAMGDGLGVAAVTALFGLTTVATMMTVVMAMCLGVGAIRLRPLERYGHALAGLVVLACGLAIKLGL